MEYPPDVFDVAVPALGGFLGEIVFNGRVEGIQTFGYPGNADFLVDVKDSFEKLQVHLLQLECISVVAYHSVLKQESQPVVFVIYHLPCHLVAVGNALSALEHIFQQCLLPRKHPQKFFN